jgi:hypothetical protein
MHSAVQMNKHIFHRLAKTGEERPDYLERVGEKCGEVWAQQLSQSVTLSAESLSERYVSLPMLGSQQAIPRGIYQY